MEMLSLPVGVTKIIILIILQLWSWGMVCVFHTTGNQAFSWGEHKIYINYNVCNDPKCPSSRESENLVLANTFGHHKASRWTWHSPNGQHHSQIDYILVRKRFWSGVNIARTWSFPRADTGSDHNLLMTSHLCLKRTSKPKHTKLKFDLEKLKDPKCWKPSKLWEAGSLHLSPSWAN